MNISTAGISYGALVKNGLYIPALLLGLAPESYMILTVFMIFDLLIGVARAIVLGGGKAFKSYKLMAGFTAKVLILCIPLLVVWAGRGAGFDFVILGQWTVGVLVLSNFYSILGHINAIRLREDSTEWDAIGMIQAKIRSILEILLIDGHSKEQDKTKLQ